MNFYFVEITDTFAGEANYSWVKRLKVKANTIRGAVNKVSRDSGMAWGCNWDNGDMMRYDSQSGNTCFFIKLWHNDIRYDVSEL